MSASYYYHTKASNNVTHCHVLVPTTTLNRQPMSGCNIGCKTLFAERGKAAPKVDLPRRHFHLRNHSVKEGEIGLCPKHYWPSRASQGLVQLTPLPFFFAKFTCNLQQGRWICGTLEVITKSFVI